MNAAPFAALVGDSNEATRKLGAILDFLGVGWQAFSSAENFLGSVSNAVPRVILAPLLTIAELVKTETRPRLADSIFAYGLEHIGASTSALASLAGKGASFESVPNEKWLATVTTDEPALTGPMRGLEVHLRRKPFDRVAKLKSRESVSEIISTDDGPTFFSLEKDGTRIFISGSCEIPDLDAPAKSKGYDVREEFFSAVPLLVYLKWAFRDAGWQASETGACWIVDDPLLRMKYGFCDFPLLDRQMQEHAFSTNIAMIPWNSRRTAPDMASLITRSSGRLSVSMHGCDHTAREFGIADQGALHAKVDVARERMHEHQERTGVVHDAVMVFPQGVFSRESLRVLQEQDFAAAVNTETLPNETPETKLTVRDLWSVAITHYGSFPLFTRRYPTDGIENFAFDILLGKPCLVVQHHGFFKGQHAEVVRFVDALNRLNSRLNWRGLGDVVRRSYQSQMAADGGVRVRMFANECLLKNTGEAEREYHIEKADAGSAGVREVAADGRPLEWQTDGETLTLVCKIPSGAEVFLQVRYNRTKGINGVRKAGMSSAAKIAARRYLSEFRDNFLSRHDALMALAQRAKRITGKRRP
ncbi:MAG: hypothetical protein ACR2HH_07630 [Chthoniobacterales bacterium]